MELKFLPFCPSDTKFAMVIINNMKYFQLLVACALLYISSSAMAFDPKLALPKAGAAVFQYTAETSAKARLHGTVSAGGLNWNCQGSRCTVSGPWPTPAVASCNALAVAVGPVRSYGHPGAQLNASQLGQCNAGLPVAAQASTTRVLGRAVTEKDFAPLVQPAPGVDIGRARAGAQYQRPANTTSPPSGPVVLRTPTLTLTGTGVAENRFRFTPVTVRTSGLTLTGTGVAENRFSFTPVAVRTPTLTLNGSGRSE